MIYLVTLQQQLFSNELYKIIGVEESLRLLEPLKIVGLDSETTGLDPWTCKVVGLCLYVKGYKPCYIPVGHVGHVTHQLLNGQVSMDLIKTQLQRCDKVKWIFHNIIKGIKAPYTTGNLNNLLQETVVPRTFIIYLLSKEYTADENL